jgi:hypothetical protein
LVSEANLLQLGIELFPILSNGLASQTMEYFCQPLYFFLNTICVIPSGEEETNKEDDDDDIGNIEEQIPSVLPFP